MAKDLELRQALTSIAADVGATKNKDLGALLPIAVALIVCGAGALFYGWNYWLQPIQLAQALEAVTVHIDASYYDENGNVVAPRYGSGVLVDSRGYILTANHLFDGLREENISNPDMAFDISVHIGRPSQGDSVRYKAEILDTDDGRDVALLEIDVSTPLDPALFCRLTLNRRQTVEVFAYGFPFGTEFAGLSGTITEAFGADGLWSAATDFQPAMSGGPVVLKRSGHVIGLIQGGPKGWGVGNRVIPISHSRSLINAYAVSPFPACE